MEILNTLAFWCLVGMLLMLGYFIRGLVWEDDKWYHAFMVGWCFAWAVFDYHMMLGLLQ